MLLFVLNVIGSVVVDVLTSKALWGMVGLAGLGVGFYFLAKFALSGGKNLESIVSKYKDAEGGKSFFANKFDEADIHSMGKVIVPMGLIMAFSTSIFAITYRNPPEKIETYVDVYEAFDEEDIPPPTEQIKLPPPPPPPPVIEVVEDDEILEEEPEIEEVEIEEEEVVEVPEVIEEEVIEEPEIFTVVEDMPRFPGCEDKGTKSEKEACAQAALMKYLNSVEYPQVAIDNDIEGKVYIRFVVYEDGKVKDVTIAKGADKWLDEAALKLVKSMPTWIPGKQRGKAARVQYILPINFKLS